MRHGTALKAKLCTAPARHVVTSIHTVNQVTTLCASYPSLAVGYAAKTRFVSDGAVAAVMSAGTTSDADLLAASPAPATTTCALRVDDCDAVHKEVLRLLIFGLFLLGLFLGLLLLGLLCWLMEHMALSNLLLGAIGVGTESVMRVA